MRLLLLIILSTISVFADSSDRLPNNRKVPPPKVVRKKGAPVKPIKRGSLLPLRRGAPAAPKPGPKLIRAPKLK